MSNPVSAAAPGGLEAQHLQIRLGSQLFAIPISRVREILEPPRITPIPKTDGWLLGVINLRGNIYSVVDIAPLVGCALAAASEASRLVIVTSEAFDLAISVNEAPGTVNLSPGDFSVSAQAGTAEENGLIAAVGHKKGTYFNVLDVDALMRHPQLTAYA